MWRFKKLILVNLVVLGLTYQSYGEITKVIDFEDIDKKLYTQLSYPDLIIQREKEVEFRVLDVRDIDPPGITGKAIWGNLSKNSFEENSRKFIIKFLTGNVFSFKIQTGDMGGNDQDKIFLEAYDKNNQSLYAENATLPLGKKFGVEFSADTKSPISYAYLWSQAGSYPNSIYIDNLEYTQIGVVPEPMSFALFGIGLVALFLIRNFHLNNLFLFKKSDI